MQFRVGQGFDIHALSSDPNRKLVLAGVEFPGEIGLQGHSDADVIAHACADALLGAAGLGDLGLHFSDADPKWKNANSLLLLEHVVTLVKQDGWEIGNIDCSIVCEQPKLAPFREMMQRNISDVVGSPVSIKGNRAEKLGSLGRGEGIAAWTVAILTKESGQ